MKCVKVWMAVAAGIVITSLMAPIAGADKTVPQTGVEGATHYSCLTDCQVQYNYCLSTGHTQAYCQNQLSICQMNCMGGAASAASDS